MRPSTDDAGRSWISYTDATADSRGQRRQREQILTLLRFAVAGGVTELAVPDGLLADREWSLLLASAPTRFLSRAMDDGDFHSPQPPLARLTLLLDAHAQRDIERTMIVHRPRHIIVVPRSVRDPGNPNRELLDVVRHLSITDILARLQA